MRGGPIWDEDDEYNVYYGKKSTCMFMSDYNDGMYVSSRCPYQIEHIVATNIFTIKERLKFFRVRINRRDSFFGFPFILISVFLSILIFTIQMAVIEELNENIDALNICSGILSEERMKEIYYEQSSSSEFRKIIMIEAIKTAKKKLSIKNQK